MSWRSIVKKFIPNRLFPKVEPYGHLVEAVLFNTLYGFPARNMKVIGVTGTNGKTTTSFLIHKMLHEAGYKTGLMTTVAHGVDNDIKPQMHHMTSVPVPQLMRRLKEMKNQNIDWLVLETTSQALAQNRVWGVPYSIAVLTNLTHEHLDWHGTFEKYREAKETLFILANRNKKGLKIGLINADDTNADMFARVIANPLLYGVEKGDLRATNVKLTATGSTYSVELSDDTYYIACHLPGSFNVYNSLAAVGVGGVIGLSKEQIEHGIAALDSVEGRMTIIKEGQDFEVIVDYAHSPDSFEKLFTDLRKIIGPSRASHVGPVQENDEQRTSRTNKYDEPATQVNDAATRQKPAGVSDSAGQQGKTERGSGKLIVMFGSAGRRDEGKRAIQGELAGKYADEVIITEEDDRDVDGREIMEQIAIGAKRAGKKDQKDLFLVHNRTEAIQFAISRAKKNDIVLLLGKGHEKTIERADGEHPWDEIGTVKKVLKNHLT